MIRRIFKLTYNELLKQFKKISIVIIMFFIIILGILLPLMAEKISINNNEYMNNRNIIKLKNSESNIELLKNASTDIEKLNLEFALADKEFWSFMKNNNINYRAWKDEELKNNIENSYRIIILNKILNGINKKVLLEANVGNISISEIEEYTSLSKEEINKKINNLIKTNKEKENIVKNNDYLKYLDRIIKEKENTIKTLNKDLKEFEENLNKNPQDETLKKDLEYIKLSINKNEKILNTYKYRYNNKIDFQEDDWKNKTLKDIEECEEDLAIPIASEEQFNRGEVKVNISKISYDEYKEIYNKNKSSLQQRIEKDWYSLNNNIPQLEFIKDARTLVDSTYDIFVILIIILLIIIGGGIVSSEFSKGTIRLLMIRPVVRWKIILSKLLALFIIAYGAIIASILISMITSGVILGFNSFQGPVIETIAGKIVTIPYIQYILNKIIMSSASILFIISLVFMISTLLKNTALAVSISTIVYLIAMPLTLVLGFTNQKWIVNTIIPYINESMLNIMSGFIQMLKVENGIELNPTWGAIQLVIISMAILIITFLIFQRKDIKN